jgi:Phage derived protein Gp49-like (DUF891)
LRTAVKREIAKLRILGVAHWRFRCYVVEYNLGVLDNWRREHQGDDKLLAKLDTRLRFLQQQPRDKWVRPYFDTLTDDCAGLGELRFEHMNVQYRFIGFASKEMEYTWLAAVTEKGGRFVPKDTCAIAQHRKRAVVADRSLAVDCDPD